MVRKNHGRETNHRDCDAVRIVVVDVDCGALVQSLEQPYIDQAPPEPGDVDTVVLLGGGTTTNLQRRSQLAPNGDRVAVAAGLYHKALAAGATQKIMCTGQQVYRTDNKYV